MPEELHAYFLGTGSTDAWEFAFEIFTGFQSGTRPPWYNELPTTVQSYFWTRWMKAELEHYDILGTSIILQAGLRLTTASDGVPATLFTSSAIAYVKSTMLYGTSELLTSQFPSESEVWSNELVLSSALPAAIALLASKKYDVATAVYSQFTSGIPPPWFTSMPSNVQSYVVLNWLPSYLAEPMTIDILAMANPSPVATPTPGPAATSQPTATREPKYRNQLTSSQKREGTIVAATIVPTVALVAIAILIWYVLRRRRARKAAGVAKGQHPPDPEQAMQRWSQTTFSTAVQSSHHHMEPSQTSPTRFPISPDSDGSCTIRRTLSESDIRSSSGLRKEIAEIELPASQVDRVELEASPSSKPDRSR